MVYVAPTPGFTYPLALTELVPNKVLLKALRIAVPYGTGVSVALFQRATGAQTTVRPWPAKPWI